MKTNTTWPVLRQYDSHHLSRISLPLGGIGTGTVGLGGRGDLRDWEIVNRPAKGFRPNAAFFALFAQEPGQPPVARAIEGPIPPEDYEGAQGSRAANHGLPRFRQCSFAAAYPLGQVLLSDSDVPLQVRIEAFNPLIPGDADASGWPIAVLRFVLSNPRGRPVTASVCGSLTNFIGIDGWATQKSWTGEEHPTGAKTNRNEFRGNGVFMSSAGVPPEVDAWGTMALATTARSGVSHRTAWANTSWSYSLLDFWDDFSADGALEEREVGNSDTPNASLAVRLRLPPRAERSVTFVLAWHFPNRKTWTPKDPKAGECACGDGGCGTADPNRVGNHYATRFSDAWDAATQAMPRLRDLESGTIEFVGALCESGLPEAVKEAALFNLSTLRSQTSFRTEDGRFFGYEGCNDKAGCCHGSCTHVWNYEQATAFLFGDLARSMREIEFKHATAANGLMSFRVNLPLARAQESGKAAADGQMGCLMKLYRDWQLSGDDAMLRDLWPGARRALEFCWVPGGWDADQDGVMEGCQHNTMDVEYYGPNPQMGIWYLGALRAAEEMARHVGEADFAAWCRSLFERGREWIDSHLFNGEYYEQEVRPAGEVAEGLRVGRGAANPGEPDYQLGAGCLVDQLVGQFMAHVCGLGHLVAPDRVRTTLRSIMRRNFKTGFHEHFNHMRSFVLGSEQGLLMATYPPGRRPKRPFPYFTEVMTGFEYTAAVGMLYEGLTADGLKCIAAVRARYDGRKRSPFDEAECGHHYARAMAAWAAILALTGFQYSAVSRSMEFAASRKAARWFWSNGSAWGTFAQSPSRAGTMVELVVLHGELALSRLKLKGRNEIAWPAPKRIKPGRPLRASIA